MRYVAFYRPAPGNPPPTPARVEAMGKFIDEALKAGVLIVTEGFGPSTDADAKVRHTGGEFIVTDGPFAETKEAIGGFALMQFKSRPEMIDWTKRFLAVAGDGESEMRKVYEMSPVDQRPR